MSKEPTIKTMHAVPKKSGYLAGLDGWRALAILAVLFDHDLLHPLLGRLGRMLHDGGGYGVDLFFAISGILITTRILEEESLFGRFNLKGFYIRRFLRIQPAATVYLLVIALLTLLGWTGGDWKTWWASMLYYRNFVLQLNSPAASAAGYFQGHFWSLAVEEHFYLILSLFLVFVRRGRVFWWSVFLTALLVWGVAISFHPSLYTYATSSRRTDWVLPWLLWPALLAMILRWQQVRRFVDRWMPPWAVVLATVPIYFLIRTLNRRLVEPKLHWIFLFDNGIVCLLEMAPLLIIAAMTHPRSWTTRILEWQPLRFVGRISYSLYLWHVLFFRGPWPVEMAQPWSPLRYLTAFPWNWIAAFAVAIASYYLIERPLMRLGHRLAPPATPGRPDLMEEPVLTPVRTA